METCCGAGQPVTADYTPVGTVDKIDDGLEAYIVGSGSRAIVAMYDIFGLEYPQVKQVADRLASAGFVVAVPDVFRGQPWPKSKFPPKPEHNLRGWLDTAGCFDQVVAPDVAKVVSHLRARGATAFGVLGFCWGAAMAARLAAAAGPSGSHARPAAFSAVAFCHPTLFNDEAALLAGVEVPLLSASAEGDPLESIQEAMAAKPCAPACVFRRYADMAHGFCAARGDFDDPRVAAAVTEVLGLLATFFSSHVK